ncbi:MFS transporter [Clostridium sp. 19966]|uniref:MFS transporter n=1 Tax=Clostridium sp. 19966 TaxID=2768166 RepID=UPI0028DFED01|nr:MFS transporter [Clostridium sp. 19966]MDT8717350.1 MFS transporter [Clostridium sp. 19966]
MVQIFTKKNIVTHNKNFMTLLLAKIVSETGNWIYYLAIIYLVAEKTKSTSSTGIVLFCNIFPPIVFGIIAGHISDKFPRKNILIISDFTGGILSLYIGFRALLGSLSIWEIYTITFLLGISKTFFSPSINASIPTIVKENELNRANSLLQSVSSITNILGPVCGGVIIAFIGTATAFILNGVSFIISAICELFVTIPYVQNSMEGKKTYYKQIINSTSTAFQFIKTNRLIKTITLIFSIMTFFVAPMILFLQQLVDKFYNMGPVALSIIMIADSLGVLLAGLLLIIRPIIKNQKLFLATFPIFCGLALIIIGNVRNFYIAVITMLFQGFYSGFGEISMMTIFQRETPDYKRGMIFSLYSMIINILTPISMLASGIVLNYIPLYLILTICGLILIACSSLLIKNLFFVKTD